MGNLVRQLRYHDWVICASITGKTAYWRGYACGVETLTRDFEKNCGGA